MAKILWAKTGFRDVPLYRLCSFLWVIPESKTGTSKERGPGLEGTGPSLPWSAHAVSETLSGTSSLTIALVRCFLCENRPDQVLALFGSKMLIFASSYVSGRQELGPELEIAVVEMTLEQQVATNYSPRSHSFRKTSFHHPPTFKCDIIFSMCCRWSGLGRGTKATSRPSICWRWTYWLYYHVNLDVRAVDSEVGVDMVKEYTWLSSSWCWCRRSQVCLLTRCWLIEDSCWFCFCCYWGRWSTISASVWGSTGGRNWLFHWLFLQTGTYWLLFFLQKFYDICDPAEENEPNTLAVKVTSAMTPHDVMNIILNGNWL